MGQPRRSYNNIRRKLRTSGVRHATRQNSYEQVYIDIIISGSLIPKIDARCHHIPLDPHTNCKECPDYNHQARECGYELHQIMHSQVKVYIFGFYMFYIK